MMDACVCVQPLQPNSFDFAENRPLYDLIGADNVEEIKTNGPAGLKNCFSLLMHSKDDDVNTCIAKLTESFHRNGKSLLNCSTANTQCH